MFIVKNAKGHINMTVIPEVKSPPEDEEEEEETGPKTDERTLPAPVAIIREGDKMNLESQLGF